MIDISSSLHIDASPQTVFSLLLPGNLSAWYNAEDELSAMLLGAGPISAGSRIELKSSRERLVVEITEYRQDERLAWRSVEGRSSSLAFTLTLSEQGVTVKATETYKPRNLIGLLLDRPLVRKMMTRFLDANLQALKEQAEAKP